jgi:4-amino-4-deoxy-L-arabinose transferase-like glycosyltransferase
MRFLKFLPYIFFLGYLALGLLTLTHYGINWDEPAHFARGQTALHFFLTGQKTFSTLPDLHNYIQDFGYFSADKNIKNGPHFSAYQYYPLSFFMENIKDRGGHPFFSDIASALSNYIFFQRLGIFPDAYSYNLYGIFLSAVLIFATYIWVRKIFGVFTAIVSSLSLALYPLFLAESHYNVKDVPETVYFSFAIYFFYFAITKFKLRYLILFSVFGAMAFATKFNFLFSVVIVVPWAIWVIRRQITARKITIGNFLKRNKHFFLYFLFIPLIIILFWIATYPASWFQPKLLLSSVNYYESIGTSPAKGFSLYAIYYVLFSTPIPILLYALVGIFGGIKLTKNTEKLAYYMIIIWFAVPILRVTIPKTSIYGGVRQIMEYIPPMAILAGIGANYVVKILGNFISKLFVFREKVLLIFLQLLIIASFSFVVYELARIHPNEGVYFNQLIGGLSGARKFGIRDSGQTLGNEYRQAINWINTNAKKNAKLALGYETQGNLPYNWVRNDIGYGNSYYSGPLRKGEYVISTMEKTDMFKWYKMRYLENYLNPVYTVSVDGVALLKVWHNNNKYLKKGYDREELIKDANFMINGNGFEVFLPQKRLVTRIELDMPDESCNQLEKNQGNFVLRKADNDTQPLILPVIYFDIFDKLSYPKPYYLLAAEEAKTITITSYIFNKCFSQIKSIKVYGLADNQK